jgi:uncharacterized integral membrane protein
LGNLWLKIKVWTKIAVAFALFVYGVIFVYQNSARPVKPWFWFGREPDTSVLILVLCAFLLGVVGTILFRTTIKTLRQLRNLRDRTRSERLEREVAEMRTKAAMLRSRAPSEEVGNGAAGETELP